MPRSIVRSVILLPVLLGFAALPIACGSSSPEEQLLTSFFRAARVRDNQTLSNIAAVTFNPNREGVVENFTVVEMGQEQRRTVDLRELTEAEARAREEEAEFSKRRQEFQASNRDAVDRVAKAQASKQPLRGRDAEFEAELTKWRDEHGEYQRRLSEARARLNSERAQAVGSLTPPGQADVDVSRMDVELISKDVVVDARVRTPEGELEPRTLVFTFQRAIGREGEETREGRWIITGLQQR
jgi:hypothetical protein